MNYTGLSCRCPCGPACHDKLGAVGMPGPNAFGMYIGATLATIVGIGAAVAGYASGEKRTMWIGVGAATAGLLVHGAAKVIYPA